MSQHHSDGWVLTHRLSVISNGVRNQISLQAPDGVQGGMAVEPSRQGVLANPAVCRRMHMPAVHPPAEKHKDLVSL